LLQVLDSFGQYLAALYPTNSQADRSQYQTVYAQRLRSEIAALAGLHFTPQLLSQLQELRFRYLATLHVGVGTFRSVQVEDVYDSQNAWRVGGFRRNGGAEFTKPKARVRSDYCGHNSGTSFGSS